MSAGLLYSTNVFLKLLVCEKYRGDVHHVWCSEQFDSRTLPAYSSNYLVPPSSNPADIFRELRRDVEANDSHSAKINQQKALLTKLAIEWHQSGIISETDKEDIAYMVARAPFEHWKPLLYVIPRPPVEYRLKPVPASQRAGLGNEFIIEDLRRAEFDIIEL